MMRGILCQRFPTGPLDSPKRGNPFVQTPSKGFRVMNAFGKNRNKRTTINGVQLAIDADAIRGQQP